MNQRIRYLFFLTVALFSVSFGQRIEAHGPMLLNVDYARFNYDTSSVYLELYFALYPRLITLENQGGSYRGAAYITTRLLDRMTKEYILDRTSLLPVNVRDTSHASYRSTLVTISGHPVPTGLYMLEILAVDSLAPSRRDSIVLELDANASLSSEWMSDIELCSSIKSSQRTMDPFYKNSLEVVPNPTVMFGVASYPVMFYYVELYNIDPSKTYQLQSAIVNVRGDTIKRSVKTRSYTIKNAVEAGPINVSSIPSGKNLLVLTMLDDEGNSLAVTQKWFYSFNPHLRQPESTPASLKANELAGLTEEELDQEFNRAQYVALVEDKNRYQQLSGVDAKTEFLSQFWVTVENGANGRAPIPRSEYLRRIGVATQRYRAFTREGWRTDRGRVHVLYAEPDEIERFPSSEDAKPYEIWHYYGLENGVEFVFIDRTGFGDYVLVHSTKREELRDETWRRYLR